MRIVYVLLIASFILSCNSNKKGKRSSDVSCYEYANTGDTIAIKIVHLVDMITGNLLYSLEGKDKNIGTILGEMKEGRLVATFSFVSEGVYSHRQVVFKLKDDYLVEGFGEIYMDGDIARFKNIDSLKYNDKMKLIKVSCRD